jgi:hypothetical protein
MVNENENTQPELNLVSEEPTAPVAEPQVEPVTETEVVETSSDPVAEPAGDSSTGHYPGNEVQEEKEDSFIQKQLQDTQERLTQVEQQNTQNQLLYETETYKQQLVTQGYSTEQVNAAAQQYYQQKIQQSTQEQNYQNSLQYREGQYKASLQIGKKFNVDPEVLLKYNSPQEMEQAAKHQSEVRALKEENAQLKKQQVPAQSFDNSTAPANASSSEERLLDLYNSGVRNPETDAAARRAAGVG